MTHSISVDKSFQTFSTPINGNQLSLVGQKMRNPTNYLSPFSRYVIPLGFLIRKHTASLFFEVSVYTVNDELISPFHGNVVKNYYIKIVLTQLHYSAIS